MKKTISELIRLSRTRNFAISVLCVVFSLIVFHVSTSANAIYIRDEQQSMLKFTFETDVDKILENYNIATLSTDVVEFTGFEGNYGEIEISRSIPVYVTINGITKTMKVANADVSDVLSAMEINFDIDDEINMPLNTKLKENDHVVVNTIDHVKKTEKVEVPFETEYRQTSLLKAGRTKLLSAGENSIAEVTYLQTIVSGELKEEKIIEEKIIKSGKPAVMLVGESGAPISPLDFECQFDGNGKPTSYKKVLTNSVATGYSSSKANVKGASGMRLYAGYVATNPSVIPYGTKMYITSADNKFVYGYAIAADTGTALMDGRIDVDLFYESYMESVLNGRRSVNIYILE
ncbi:MAG: G5 domain-containing protein [Oscillospiraceae bacterium]